MLPYLILENNQNIKENVFRIEESILLDILYAFPNEDFCQYVCKISIIRSFFGGSRRKFCQKKIIKLFKFLFFTSKVEEKKAKNPEIFKEN